MRKYSDIVIVGAGASGLLCGALVAGQGKSVVIIEKNNRIGKKLLATGNGRCNFTNLHMDTSCFYSKKDWLEKILQKVTPEDVILQFEKLGVLHREREGYVYPHTNQATTVVSALHRFCEKTSVDIVLECSVNHIRKKENGQMFLVQTSQGEICCQQLVLATGGAAGKESGGSFSGYSLVKDVGHRVSPCYPGLTGLICEGKQWKQVAGTRIQGRFSLLIDGKRKEGETGEIQIVKNGVSGIPVFQLCRVAAEALACGKFVEGEIDFVPGLNKEKLTQWLDIYGKEGLVPAKWLPVLRDGDVKQLKSYRFSIKDTFGMERAQVTAGGVFLSEVNPSTMESKRQNHLYLTGELLHTDGKCGGYNLHFAWATAMIAAEAIIAK